MSYQVSALKYRPQKFDQVVGQSHVTDTLKKGLQSDRMAHALLFCGPRGVGKTTVARILAKALNCENPGEDKEPCNNCLSCQSFNSGSSFNIMELDAASNNRVEHIRNLVEQVGYQPQRGRYKVFIIDEVHMLSASAFNAFLKTLEEPPPYAIFILATTEKHKILPTILSRCQIYDFKRIPILEMIQQMVEICNREQIDFEEEGLNLIAQKADGALRDALSLFDKLNSVTDGHLSYQEVIKSLNLLDKEHFFSFTNWFFTGNIGEVLNSLDEILSDGFEGDLVLEGLREHFRELLVCKIEESRHLMQSGERFVKKYEEQASSCSKSFILSAMNLISEALFQYKEASNKRFHVELTLSKLAVMNHFISTPANSVPVDRKSNTPSSPNPLPKKTTSEKKNNIGEEEGIPKNQKAVDETQKSLDNSPEKDEEKPSNEDVKIIKGKSPQESKIGNQDADKVTDVADKESFPPGNEKEKSKAVRQKGNRLPKLQSLSSVKKRVEENKKSAKNSGLELTYENLNELWKKHAKQVSSPSSKVSLKKAKLSIDGNKIRIGTFGEVTLQTIKMEKDLINLLRTSFREKNVDVEVYIDEAMMKANEKEKPKLSSSREKFDRLVEKNSSLEKLVKKMKLKIVD